MKRFKLKTEDRKSLVQRISELTGEKLKYTGVPRCAYEGSGFTVTKDESLETEGADQAVIATLLAEGLIEAESPLDGNAVTETGETAQKPDTAAQKAVKRAWEPIDLTVEMPMKNHTAQTLQNLINLLYTRGPIINKALGTFFKIPKELVETLQHENRIEEMLQTISDYEKVTDGLFISGERIVFDALPPTADPELLRTFTTLIGLMNKQALEQKRIAAKEITEPNEKYAMRIWLTRIGMNGPEFKEARRILLRNLSGHSAFRTEADQEKWKARRAAESEVTA